MSDMGTPSKQKTKMGRPPLPAEEKLGEQLNVRATRAERALLEAEAKRLGISVSELLMRPWRKKRERR